MSKFRASECWGYSLLLSPVWGVVYALMKADRKDVTVHVWKAGSEMELLAENKETEGSLKAGTALVLLVVGVIAFIIWY